MKNIPHFFIWSISMLFLASCSDDFLDLAPLSNSNANNFYQTREDFDLAINNAYGTLYVMYGPESAVSYCGEQMSDNATLYNVAGIQADRWAFKDYEIRPSNTVVYQFWQEAYNSLYSINIVLENLESADLENSFREQAKAEMLFLRALYYFNMVRIWGALPLVTSPVSAEESYEILRSPESEVYDLIQGDLQFAVENLPSVSGEPLPGKATREAALTLLGKVHLTLGAKESAIQVLGEVINSGSFSLLPAYQLLWDVNNKNTSESIFEIQYKGGPGNPYSPYWSAFTPTENFALTLYGGGMNQVTDQLWEAYEEGDPRRDISIFTGYYDNAGNFIPILFPKKWVDSTAQTVNGRELSNNNFMILRYADVLLMMSEATGDPTYLNQVRARVGLAPFGSSGYPTNQYPTLELAIEHERQVELAMEFHRWFDLKRTGRVAPVMQELGIQVSNDELKLPIPEIVLQQNAALQQNNGY